MPTEVSKQQIHVRVTSDTKAIMDALQQKYGLTQGSVIDMVFAGGISTEQVTEVRNATNDE